MTQDDDTAALVAEAREAVRDDWVETRPFGTEDLLTRLAAALEAAQAREAFVLKAAWPSWMHDYTRAADALSVAAQTTGGVAGPDQGLMDAISRYAEARAIVRQKTADFARAALGDTP